VKKIGRIPGGKGLLPMPPPGGVSRPVQPERVSVTKACQVMGPTLPSMAKPGTSLSNGGLKSAYPRLGPGTEYAVHLEGQ
jgi:hypothetical protein